MLGDNDFLTFFFLYMCSHALNINVLTWKAYALKHMNWK